MTEPLPRPPVLPLPPPARRQGGFTLLEIMIALAILAVGAVCVLSTFAAALALHMRRESDVRMARVMEESRTEAQAAWDAWSPSREAPLPPDLKDLAYSRDTSLSYSIIFAPVSGQPAGPAGVTGGVKAVVRVHREGDPADKVRSMEFFLVRSGFSAAEKKGSVTYEMERAADKMKKTDPSERSPR
jgi:prepilin-type N-terminal cleavage/methylation domain-containing protein